MFFQLLNSGPLLLLGLSLYMIQRAVVVCQFTTDYLLVAVQDIHANHRRLSHRHRSASEQRSPHRYYIASGCSTALDKIASNLHIIASCSHLEVLKEPGDAPQLA